MQIDVEQWGKKHSDISLAQAIKNHMLDSDCRGSVENLHEKVENIATALGNLVETLVDDGEFKFITELLAKLEKELP